MRLPKSTTEGATETAPKEDWGLQDIAWIPAQAAAKIGIQKEDIDAKP